ncbi:aminoacyl-histidine dipeptidase [Actinobacillus pleuropneumoniae]|uniref:aminoacyl-histidine dipeptidase n=1 Tax=Actinobacillus pleuropneumoniae TaxID=715 RepID=UPI0005C503FF|nr:aminoacyl-histidine dipeptidase [Actinobacillus pleuropneumoniae]MBT9318358.1 aminoacyl-histidine dipeptidase [Actinobacillus pleuropneumoniae]MBT9343419.1 aminoacyl-histidine dipeptidase [Actinobacillus pleuropneumoniae]UKH28041.1 aminoacyl-histidine dipeptidase [Actinobacillus pleuropneumoniae]
MSEITKLSPTLLWQWFDKICAIPHPSYHENQLAEFIVDWAKSKNLFAERDEAGNVLIRKPATQGMENRCTIALQAHLDMVPQANAAAQHDFLKDPIQPYIDGEWVKAKGTTLGADNGIGLASCLAVLEADDIAHPALEILLTMSEEVGMEGVLGLRPNWLKSDIMINTDTEENGEIYIGCAGGENINLSLPLQYETNAHDSALQITLKGLQGGHSGCDIHTTRANAIKLMARILAEIQTHYPIQISALKGGSVRNAIPREAQVTLTVAANHQQNVIAYLTELAKKIQNELRLAEANLKLEIEPSQLPNQSLAIESTQKVIHLLNVLPNGIIRNSDVVKDVVETSLSIGLVKIEEQQLTATILARSLIESGKEDVRGKINSLAALTGAKVAFSGNYPGWEPDTQSRITPLTKAIYDEVLGYEAQVKVIHAGLECGLIKKVYPNMDLVSIGPTIQNAHSPDEKVHIPAVEIYWKLLTKLLAQAPVK